MSYFVPIKNNKLTKKGANRLLKYEWALKCFLCKTIIGYMENPMQDGHYNPTVFCSKCVHDSK